MKFALLVLCLAVGVLAQNQYGSEYDDFDLSEVIGNPRLMMAYSKCLLDEGPCTAEVRRLRDNLPNALETQCAKCTEKQKHMAKILAQEVKKNYPEIWKKLVAKYDPQGKYQQAWKDFLKE